MSRLSINAFITNCHTIVLFDLATQIYALLTFHFNEIKTGKQRIYRSIQDLTSNSRNTRRQYTWQLTSVAIRQQQTKTGRFPPSFPPPPPAPAPRVPIGRCLKDGSWRARKGARRRRRAPSAPRVIFPAKTLLFGGLHFYQISRMTVSCVWGEHFVSICHG